MCYVYIHPIGSDRIPLPLRCVLCTPHIAGEAGGNVVPACFEICNLLKAGNSHTFAKYLYLVSCAARDCTQQHWKVQTCAHQHCIVDVKLGELRCNARRSCSTSHH